MSDHLDSRAGRLAAALDDFLASSPDVEAAAVVSFDGLPMASALPDHLEEDRVGAMSAALLSLGEQAAMGLGRGRLNQVFVEGEHGFVFLMSCRDQAVLAAVADRSAKIGFMLYEMRRAAETVGRALETANPADEPAPAVEPSRAPHLAAVPSAPSWTHPATYGQDDEPAEQAVAAFAAPVPAPGAAAAWDAPSTPAAGGWDEPAAPAGAGDEPAAPAGAWNEPAEPGAPTWDESREAVAPAAEVPSWARPVAEHVASEPAWSRPQEEPYEALGELRAVLAESLSTPAPSAPPPAAPADADAGDGGHEADLLAVLATEPLSHADDHDLLTEALFEVRRATGSEASQVPSWARPDAADNGWG